MSRNLVSEKMNKHIDNLESFLLSRYILGILWIGLGITTYQQQYATELIGVYGPIFVGVLCLFKKTATSGLYYVFTFAVAADRVLQYAAENVWSPLFVWMILFVYMTRTARSAS
jgi:hypothetical protein